MVLGFSFLFSGHLINYLDNQVPMMKAPETTLSMHSIDPFQAIGIHYFLRVLRPVLPIV